MSYHYDELLKAAQEATAAYADRQKDTANAEYSLQHGFGSIEQLTTATYLESEARTRWLRASEAFVSFNN